jgi:hypothetical protein
VLDENLNTIMEKEYKIEGVLAFYPENRFAVINNPTIEIFDLNEPTKEGIKLDRFGLHHIYKDIVSYHNYELRSPSKKIYNHI